MTPDRQMAQARHEWELRDWLRIATRHKLIIVSGLLLGLATAWLIGRHAIPRYEAEAQVVFDVRSTHVVKFDAVLSSLPPQPEVLYTEMDIIGSRAMAERVVERLTSAEIRQLVAAEATPSPLSKFLAELRTRWSSALDRWPALDSLHVLRPDSTAVASTEAAREDAVGSADLPDTGGLVNMVLGGVQVSNDGRSYTIYIGYSSADPELAAALANHYAEAYIAHQLELKAKATQRASAWLSQRLVDLRHDLEASETAVQAYRQATGLLREDGGTVTTRQLEEINSQLVQARDARVEAESRLEAAQSLRANGDIEAAADVLSSDVIQTLRMFESEVKRRQADITSRYTERYPSMNDLQADLAALDRQMADEMNRIARSLANQADAARRKEQALERELDRLQARFGEGSEDEIKLRQLQREADVNRVLYEAYLSRFKETSEQQKLQEPESYLISSAMPPRVPSYPRTMPLLALGAILGALGGVGLAFGRELFDPRLHSIGEVEEATGLPVLALLPSLPRVRRGRPEDYVLRRPRSLFTEALRTARAAIALSHDDGCGKVMMITSAIPGEGKTAFCLSLARSLASDAHGVLLIDADLRRPGIGRALGARGGSHHLSEILTGEIDLLDAIQVDGKSGASYIPARDDGAGNPHELLGSERMAQLIEEARARYDVIIIDTPPVLVVADAAIIAKLADHCLFFIRWGGTAREYVDNALRRLALYKVPVSGIVLSHVNMRRHARYAAGEGYYRAYGARSDTRPLVRIP